MEILAVRLKGQLAENSKILSYQSVFPEHNHNEIEGWNNLEELTSKFSILWLKDENDNFIVIESGAGLEFEIPNIDNSENL